MDIMHRLKSKILKYEKLKFTTFQKVALLPSSGEGRGEETQQSRCSILLPLLSPEDGSRTSFRNVVNFSF
jgi:hypothetical protein